MLVIISGFLTIVGFLIFIFKKELLLLIFRNELLVDKHIRNLKNDLMCKNRIILMNEDAKKLRIIRKALWYLSDESFYKFTDDDKLQASNFNIDNYSNIFKEHSKKKFRIFKKYNHTIDFFLKELKTILKQKRKDDLMMSYFLLSKRLNGENYLYDYNNSNYIFDGLQIEFCNYLNKHNIPLENNILLLK